MMYLRYFVSILCSTSLIYTAGAFIMLDWYWLSDTTPSFRFWIATVWGAVTWILATWSSLE